MSNVTKIRSSKTSSLTYLLKQLMVEPQESYDEQSIEIYTYLDSLLETYTDELAVRFQRMLVNRRAVKESDDVMFVNDGVQNKAVFDLDMIHLDTHIECALLTQFSSGGRHTPMEVAFCKRHTPFLEVLQHTKTYGDSDGMSFREMLCRKLRRKLNHISKYVQNKTRVNGELKLGTQLFNVSTEVLFEDNVRVGLIQAVLTASE
jgi:hypothetical protein